LLELDTAFQGAGFRNRLANLQQESATNLGNRVALVYWMIGHGLAKDVTDWLDAGGKSAPVPLQMALADAFRAQQNWPRLREMLEPTDWAANDFIRKALLARCERNEASRHLARSDGSPILLPEEQALAMKIKSKIGQH
jgi:hypothetical protein